MDRADDPRVRHLRRALLRHVPADAVEQRSRDRTLRALEELAHPFDERADTTHVTGSAIVTDDLGRIVLHRHKRLGIWLQPGGHVDGPEDPATAAVRETREETGLAARHPVDGPRILHVDVHPGPRGHLHLDIRYALRAGAATPLAPGAGESTEVGWFTLQQAIGVADASLAAAIRALDRHAAHRAR